MLKQKLICLTVFLLGAVCSFAQVDEESAGGSVEANNPLASFTAFNVHNYYTPELTGLPDQTSNTMWLRYAKPVGKWLFRASLPFSHVPTGATSSQSGMGDLNIFAAYLFDVDKPGVAFGIGPQVTFDTASDNATGTGKTQAGLAVVYFDGSSPVFQWGGLVTWQTDVAGDSARADTELFVAQPFYFLQLGGGYYFRGAPNWVFNREADTYHVPIGAGIGRVIMTEKVVFNLFFEPQFTVLSKGDGQPKLQLFAGFNMQFK